MNDLNRNIFMDLHNHTKFSDGINSIEEVVQNAEQNGISVVGITDHGMTWKCKSVSETEFDNYFFEVQQSKKFHTENITVLAGIELCISEYFSDINSFPVEKLNKLDFILLEYLDNQLFAGNIGMKEIEKFVLKIDSDTRIGLAHTNMQKLMDRFGRANVLAFMSYYRIFYELNFSYRYFFEILDTKNSAATIEMFAELNKAEIGVSVGSDTHDISAYKRKWLLVAHEFDLRYILFDKNGFHSKY